MAISRSWAIGISSTGVMIITIVLLLTTFHAHTRQMQLQSHNMLSESSGDAASKPHVNDTTFEQVNMWSGNKSIDDKSTTANPSSSAVTSVHDPLPTPATLRYPIAALSYTGSSGPKHCRGGLIQNMEFPRPAEQWKNGICITVPLIARCGIFVAEKGDRCEAKLFNAPNCYDSPATYVNTVVFMPEERSVGGMWSSMLVKCAVDVPAVSVVDPAILGDALRKGG